MKRLFCFILVLGLLFSCVGTFKNRTALDSELIASGPQVGDPMPSVLDFPMIRCDPFLNEVNEIVGHVHFHMEWNRNVMLAFHQICKGELMREPFIVLLVVTDRLYVDNDP